eukprot:6190523-Pyramimonas_sp.AAC.1
MRKLGDARRRPVESRKAGEVGGQAGPVAAPAAPAALAAAAPSVLSRPLALALVSSRAFLAPFKI